MSPLFLANWREINRVFCAVCWMAALVLAAVIVGVAANTSSVGALGRSAQAGQTAGSNVLQVHRRP